MSANRPAQVVLRGSDWPELRRQGRRGGYTMTPSNSGVSIMAVFIHDETIHETTLDAVERWLTTTTLTH